MRSAAGGSWHQAQTGGFSCVAARGARPAAGNARRGWLCRGPGRRNRISLGRARAAL